MLQAIRQRSQTSLSSLLSVSEIIGCKLKNLFNDPTEK